MGMSFLLLAVLIVFLYFVGVLLFQWLWNITIPMQFGLKELRFWAAFRLLLIAGFLTSGGLLHFKF
jgi:hypothetical protein